MKNIFVRLRENSHEAERLRCRRLDEKERAMTESVRVSCAEGTFNRKIYYHSNFQTSTVRKQDLEREIMNSNDPASCIIKEKLGVRH
jgi:hypothetical protein